MRNSFNRKILCVYFSESAHARACVRAHVCVCVCVWHMHMYMSGVIVFQTHFTLYFETY